MDATSSGIGGKRRIALLTQYDGTNFNGWQIQENGITVQQEIENALSILTKETIRVTASGRTDSGVHALGQVVHFDTESDVTLERFCIGLNGILPKSIAIKNAYHVTSDFHARFSAQEREYRYYIYNYNQRSPFVQYRTMWYHKYLDIEFLKEASRFLIGEYDFASFCKKISTDESTIRTINDISIVRYNELIEITITANAFLHNMIRIIVGTFIHLHKNNGDPREIKKILACADRDMAGPTAPPFGLYLMKVTYEPPLNNYSAAYKECT